MKVFVSSYAATKRGSPWDRDAESTLFDGLARMDLAGLELPFYGRLHEHDDAWLLERLHLDWQFIVTLLPGTMDRLGKDPAFGLASPDPAGRQRALDFAESARRMVSHLRGYLGLKAVAAVIIHSAPRQKSGAAKVSMKALAASLTELRSRDWSGAELLVEHCDAATKAHTADKGFLGLKDEIAAIKASKGATPVRVLVNWGRSALETRSAAGPLAHIRTAKTSKLLAGLFFSGAAPKDALYGAWKDSHAPFDISCPASILTVNVAKAALKAAGDIDYLGLKIQPLPASLGTNERLALLRANLDALESAAMGRMAADRAARRGKRTPSAR